MSKKITAVEWLQECLQLHLTHDQKMQYEGLFQQAKEIEKEQIEEAFNLGYDQWTVKTSEQYYKETYEQE